MKYLRTIAMFVAVIGSACKKSPTAVYCQAELLPALMVTVRDSVTGALVSNVSLKTVGPYSDSAAVSSNLDLYPVSLAGPPGTYLLTVRAVGYSTWAQSETVPPIDSCALPQTLLVSVRLQPTS